MKITFDGKKKVNAEVNGQIIKTDQDIISGGEGSAPEPFTLFLASIGTCAGIYVKSFCDQRNIPTDNISLSQEAFFNQESRMIDKIEVKINLPDDFPEKYKKPIVNSANLCAVKKHLLNAPDIDVVTERSSK